MRVLARSGPVCLSSDVFCLLLPLFLTTSPLMPCRYESTPTLFPISSPPDPYFTSARIRTFRHYSVRPTAQYPTIRVEARIKVPAATGLWPAFW